MKRSFFVSAVVVFGVAVCHAEQQRIRNPQGGNVSRPVAHGSQESKRGDSDRGILPWGLFGNRRDHAESETEGEGHPVSQGMLSNAHPAPPSQEYFHLKEIAALLSIPVLEHDTPSDIAFKIRQRLGETERYRGKVLSEASFDKAKSAIRIPEDAEAFAEYHKFIKKIADTKLIIMERTKEP